MGKFSGVLIVTDLDGTHLNSRKQVDKKSREAVEYFMSEGGFFTFATGRLYQSFQNVRGRLSQNAPVVFANGAQIYDMESETLLWECGLEADIEPLCTQVLRVFPGTAAEVYRHLKCDTVNENGITRKHLVDFEIERTVHSSLSQIDKPWTKVLFTNETAVLKEISDYITSRYNKANALFSSAYYLEVFSSATDKGRGARRLADMLGVDYKNLYTAGDQENDYDLLSAAAISFAPENALPEVKKRVNVVLPDNDHDTLAALISYIEKLY